MVEGQDGQSGTPAEEPGFEKSELRQGELNIPDVGASNKVIDVQLGDMDSLNSSAANNLVTARGTGDGLIIRLDGRVEANVIEQALKDYITSRKGFLTGNDVVLEWVGKKPEDDAVSKVTSILSEDFNIVVRSSRMKERKSMSSTKEQSSNVSTASISPDKTLSLFDGIEALSGNDEVPLSSTGSSKFSAADSALWDEADARIVGGTLRSGQKIESDHSLIVLGDVNSGAEVVAGGDIIVLGKLRGVAHAGAYDETGGGRFIFALELQPTQLRIGTVISRGGADGGKSAEIAKVDGNLIVVEPYNARSAMRRGNI